MLCVCSPDPVPPLILAVIRFHCSYLAPFGNFLWFKLSKTQVLVYLGTGHYLCRGAGGRGGGEGKIF